MLLGGTGEDTFFFTACSGSDSILDFQDGLDVIFIANWVSSFADLPLSMSGADTIVDFLGTSIQLNGINSSRITADDFAFA
ncbi:hypothetical protein [Roseibium sp. M-1]